MAPLDLPGAQVFKYTSAAPVVDRAVNLMATATPEPLQQPLQFAERAVSSTASAAKIVPGSADAKEPPVSKKNVTSNPAEKNKLAKARALRNLGDGQNLIMAGPDVEESSVVREWFVDHVVER